MTLARRLFLALPLAAPALSSAKAGAGWRPSRPVTIILPIGPGGASDHMFRAIQAGVSARLGQPLVIEHRPGGGTVIGTEIAARAAPDGHTLCLAANSTLINQGLHGARLPYDVFRDFEPIARLGIVPHVLVCHPSVATDVAGLAAFARRRAGGLTFASYGQGTSNHLGFEMLRLLADFPATHVPYRGGGPAYADLMAGRVDAMFMNIPGSFQPVETGQMRALAVAGDRRHPRIPAPALAEVGLGEVLSNTWSGVIAPTGLPPGAARALEEAFLGAVTEPATRARLEDTGFSLVPEPAAVFAETMRRDFAVYLSVIRRARVEVG